MIRLPDESLGEEDFWDTKYYEYYSPDEEYEQDIVDIVELKLTLEGMEPLKALLEARKFFFSIEEDSIVDNWQELIYLNKEGLLKWEIKPVKKPVKKMVYIFNEASFIAGDSLTVNEAIEKAEYVKEMEVKLHPVFISPPKETFSNHASGTAIDLKAPFSTPKRIDHTGIIYPEGFSLDELLKPRTR